MAMEFRQMHYFAQVVEAGSFTAAARRCHLAQPSLSQQIQKLEEELGEPLLQRRARGVAPTEAGQRVYEEALALLAARDRLLDSFQEREELRTGEVTFGAIPTIAPYLLGRLLAPFRIEFPRVQIRVREAPTADLIRMVVDEEVDFAVVSDIRATDRKRWSLYVKTVFQEPILLAVPRSHELARSKQGTLQPADIPREQLLFLGEGHCLREQTLKVCRTRKPDEAFQCEQLPTVQTLVAAGLGIAFVPAMFVADHPVAGVSYLRLRAPQPLRAINVMKRRGRKLTPPAESLFRQILEFDPESGPGGGGAP